MCAREYAYTLTPNDLNIYSNTRNDATHSSYISDLLALLTHVRSIRNIRAYVYAKHGTYIHNYFYIYCQVFVKCKRGILRGYLLLSSVFKEACEAVLPAHENLLTTSLLKIFGTDFRVKILSHFHILKIAAPLQNTLGMDLPLMCVI